jgi:hypothetical protein
MAYYGRQGVDTPIAMNLLAETVIRVTGSRSEIVHEALPVDDPKLVDPTSPEPRRSSAGNLKSNSKKVCGECCRALEGSR